MANPLKLLKLKPTNFQILQEIPVKAPPAKVWKTLLACKWFEFEPGRTDCSLEAKIGGRFMMAHRDGSVERLFGFVSHLEPNKLLRIYGPGVMSHLPTSTALIWEVQPAKSGSVLRFCQRSYGAMTSDAKKSQEKGWKFMHGNLKKLAEK